MSTYQDRKAERTQRFASQVSGWKLVKCSACSGSGYYDSARSPRCGCCGGTGRVRVSPAEYLAHKEAEEKHLEAQREHERMMEMDPGCRGISRAYKEFRAGHRDPRTEAHEDDMDAIKHTKHLDEYLRYYNEEMRSQCERLWSKTYGTEHLQPARGV